MSSNSRSEMTQTEPFRSAAQQDYEPYNRMKDAYTDKELGVRCGIEIGQAYMVGNKVVIIDGIDVEGATRGPNGKWRCRTKTAQPLIKRTVGQLTFYDAHPTGSGIININLNEGEERTFDTFEWTEFKQEHNVYLLDQRRENVFELHK